MTLVFVVTEADLASALGSGDVPVLGTPRLVAWLEAATVSAAAPELMPGETTVGTAVAIEHLAPSALGTSVTVSASIVAVRGRSIVFDCEAVDERAVVVARGSITRARVDRARFLIRLSG